MSLTYEEGRIEYMSHIFDYSQNMIDKLEVMNDFGSHGWKLIQIQHNIFWFMRCMKEVK